MSREPPPHNSHLDSRDVLLALQRQNLALSHALLRKRRLRAAAAAAAASATASPRPSPASSSVPGPTGASPDDLLALAEALNEIMDRHDQQRRDSAANRQLALVEAQQRTLDQMVRVLQDSHTQQQQQQRLLPQAPAPIEPSRAGRKVSFVQKRWADAHHDDKEHPRPRRASIEPPTAAQAPPPAQGSEGAARRGRPRPSTGSGSSSRRPRLRKPRPEPVAPSDSDSSSQDGGDRERRSPDSSNPSNNVSDTVRRLQELSSSKLASKRSALSRFRAWALVPVFFLRTRNAAQRRVQARREKTRREFADVVDLYLEMARVWLARALRVPMRSILANSSLEFSLTRARTAGFLGRFTRPLSVSEVQQRVIKIKVHVAHLVRALLGLVRGSGTPPSLEAFVARYLVPDGAFYPEGFLFPAEEAALLVDRHGATLGLGEAHKRMLVMNFFVGRVLLPLVLRPWEAGLGSQPRGRTTAPKNLRIVASILYRALQRALRESGLRTGRPKGRRIGAAAAEKSAGASSAENSDAAGAGGGKSRPGRVPNPLLGPSSGGDSPTPVKAAWLDVCDHELVAELIPDSSPLWDHVGDVIDDSSEGLVEWSRLVLDSALSRSAATAAGG